MVYQMLTKLLAGWVFLYVIFSFSLGDAGAEAALEGQEFRTPVLPAAPGGQTSRTLVLAPAKSLLPLCWLRLLRPENSYPGTGGGL